MVAEYPFQFAQEELDLLEPKDFAVMDSGSLQERFHNRRPEGSGTLSTGSNMNTVTSDVWSQERGIEFSDAFPRCDEFSLEVTEAEFAEITRRKQLDYSRSADRTSYFIPTENGHTLMVMFRNNAKNTSACRLFVERRNSQNLRGEAKARATRKSSSFGKIQHGLNAGLAIHGLGKRFAKGGWGVWECYPRMLVKSQALLVLARYDRAKSHDGDRS